MLADLCGDSKLHSVYLWKSRTRGTNRVRGVHLIVLFSKPILYRELLFLSKVLKIEFDISKSKRPIQTTVKQLSQQNNTTIFPIKNKTQNVKSNFQHTKSIVM